MKNNVLECLKPALVLILSLSVLSCSNENLEEEVLETYDFKIEKAESVEDQLEMLTKAMRRFENFQVAVAQGYEPVSPLVEGMGIHYENSKYVDDKFEILKPEILVYHPDENGLMQFVAAEYLMEVEDCIQENVDSYTAPSVGFMGDDDQWSLNCRAGGWTRHAWVG